MSGIVMSKPSMISEDIGQIEGADAYSIIESFKSQSLPSPEMMLGHFSRQ